MITFKANFINTSSIQKYKNKKQGYKPVLANFVELNPFSKSDAMALDETERFWASGDTYLGKINHNFHRYQYTGESSFDTHFFALTTQEEDFKNFAPENILGAVQVSKIGEDYIQIDMLQSDPDNNHFSKHPMFKEIGTAIVKSLIELFKDKVILLQPDKNAIPFYKKLGFQFIDKKNMMLKR